MGFLTTEQLAVHLGVSARQIQRLVSFGLPSVLVGARARRYDPEACIAWLQANEGALTRGQIPPVATKSTATAVSAYTDAYRRARLRVMPSHPKSG